MHVIIIYGLQVVLQEQEEALSLTVDLAVHLSESISDDQ